MNSEFETSLIDIDPFFKLRAEDEGDWLFDCFVSPQGFEQIISPRSMILFGDPGSGKTATYKAIRNNCYLNNGRLRFIPVEWKPKPLPSNVEGGVQWINEQLRFLFDACSMKIVELLLNYSDELDQAPPWVLARLSWFFKFSILGDPLLRLGPVLKNQLLGQKVETLLSFPSSGLFYENPSPEQIINELITSLGYFDINSIWVLADDVREWEVADSVTIERSLNSFMSMLSLFENTGLAFKYILPSKLEIPLAQASGIVRRRIEKHNLTWNPYLLRLLVEKRLTRVFQADAFSLNRLCKDPEFENWLLHFGGSAPRDWLELASPFVRYYGESNLKRPIEKIEWKEIRSKNPLRLQLDEKDYLVKLGGRIIPINDLPPKVYTLLLFLYKHAGELISKERLYYQAYLGLGGIPSRDDKGYEEPSTYNGLIDTSIYRLRQVIEPDPANPVILQTERGHGVRLVATRW